MPRSGAHPATSPAWEEVGSRRARLSDGVAVFAACLCLVPGKIALDEMWRYVRSADPACLVCALTLFLPPHRATSWRALGAAVVLPDGRTRAQARLPTLVVKSICSS